MLDIEDNVPLAKGNTLFLGKVLKRASLKKKYTIVLSVLGITHLLTNNIWLH